MAKALELNPLLASAYAVQGWIAAHYDWDWDDAERSLRRAIELDPLNAAMRGHLVLHFDFAGEFAMAIEAAKTARDLDPNWAFDGLRGDPRFDNVVARVGLPPNR